MTNQQTHVSPDAEPGRELANLCDVALDDRRRRQEFHTHVIVYVAVHAVLGAIGLVTVTVGGATWFPWPIFLMFGWGVGITIHAWDTYGAGRPPGSPITEIEVQPEMDRRSADR